MADAARAAPTVDLPVLFDGVAALRVPWVSAAAPDVGAKGEVVLQPARTVGLVPGESGWDLVYQRRWATQGAGSIRFEG